MSTDMDQATDYRDWKGWDRENFAKVPQELAVYFEAELGKAGVSLDGPLEVLELGFGNGGFAGFCHERGFGYSGTEIDAELVDRAQANGFEVVAADPDLTALFEGRKFDLIVAFDVLEHLTQDEIIEALGHVSGLLTAGGRMIARFPSGDSPFSFGMQNGDMTHRTHIGSGMVRQFCLATGLRPHQIRGPVLPIQGLGLRRAMRRAAVRAARAFVATFVRVAYMDNQPRVIDPNMLIVLEKSDGD